jgi:hypothetical protein
MQDSVITQSDNLLIEEHKLYEQHLSTHKVSEGSKYLLCDKKMTNGYSGNFWKCWKQE